MQQRQGMIEIFSTFLQFEADYFKAWVADPKLRRNMQKCLSISPQKETSENFWALYWYKVWKFENTSIAKDHLTAYLQETCYWSAKKTAASFASSTSGVSDCFQIAIARTDKVLKGFNPNQGYNLKNYASAIFSSVIRENLRQRHQVDICTPWALLRKISSKRLIECLQHIGLPSKIIAAYVLAWNCFKTLYVPNQATATRKLTKPDSATWEAIASLYNSQRHQQLNPSGPESNAQTLEKWLLTCEKAARNYLYPSLTSLNTPKEGQESGEWLDNLPGHTESLLTQIVTQEEEQTRVSQQSQISSVLLAAIAALDRQAQELLRLYYTQELTQQQIAEQLQIKQYTVSRRLTRSRELLLLKLAEWSRDTLHISLNSNVLKDTSTVLDEWLQVYYRQNSSMPSYREQLI